MPAKWEINEDIDAAAPEEGNRQTLEALAFGAESVHFFLAAKDVSFQLETLLSRVYLDYISLQFSGPGVTGGPAAVLAAFAALVNEQGVSVQNVRGSLYFDPATDRLTDWRYLSELLPYARETPPCVAPSCVPPSLGPAPLPPSPSSSAPSGS